MLADLKSLVTTELGIVQRMAQAGETVVERSDLVCKSKMWTSQSILLPFLVQFSCSGGSG